MRSLARGDAVLELDIDRPGDGLREAPDQRRADNRETTIWLVLLTLLMPFMFYPPVGPKLNVSAADVVVPFAFLAAMRRPHGSLRLTFPWALGMLAAASCSALVAVVAEPSTNVSLALIGVLKWTINAMYLVTFAALLTRALRSGDTRWLRTWTVTASVISVGTLLAAFLGLPTSGVFAGRFTGSFEDPNLYGTYLALSIALLAAQNGSRLFVTGIQLLLLTAALVLTSSRGAMLATLPALACIPLIYLRRNPIGWLLFALPAAAALMVIPNSLWSSFQSSVGRIRGGDFSTLSSRTVHWRDSMEAWATMPLTGIGPAQTPTVTAHGLVAHNTFVGVLAELGVVGVLLTMGPLVVIALLALMRVSKQGRLALVVLYTTLFIGMLSLNLENARFTWLIAALGVAVLVRADDGSAARPLRPMSQPGF